MIFWICWLITEFWLWTELFALTPLYPSISTLRNMDQCWLEKNTTAKVWPWEDPEKTLRPATQIWAFIALVPSLHTDLGRRRIHRRGWAISMAITRSTGKEFFHHIFLRLISCSVNLRIVTADVVTNWQIHMCMITSGQGHIVLRIWCLSRIHPRCNDGFIKCRIVGQLTLYLVSPQCRRLLARTDSYR